MNNIVFAGSAPPEQMRKNKYLQVIIADTGGVTAVPPQCEYGGKYDGVCVLIEQPLLNLKTAVTFPDVENGGILFAARQAAAFFNADGTKNQLVLVALGNLITAYVALKTSPDKRYSPTVQLVADAICGNVSDRTFNLEAEMKKLPHNYDYIRKLFKKETGVTPREFLLKQRMELAQKLLTGGAANKYSSYTVSQIAEACGFSEPLYFSRVFKKYYGVSPSNYEK